jgi:hypothetical protein
MALTESDLTEILLHCRDLAAAADHLDGLNISRGADAETLLNFWVGPHADTFGQRAGDDSQSMRDRSRNLRAEADEWARVWADTVNQINSQRREDAVEAERHRRGTGEQFFDIFLGDDSDDQVRDYVPVPVPTAASGYAATGGLETFD